MTSDPASITAAELRVIREGLGLSSGDLAAFLRIDRRTITRWEAGDTSQPGALIPPAVAERINRLQAETTQLIDGEINRRSTRPDAEAPLVTFRNDAQFWEHHPERRPLPASWHRALCYRIAESGAARTVIYADQQP